jgi:hypothetical protein
LITWRSCCVTASFNLDTQRFFFNILVLVLLRHSIFVNAFLILLLKWMMHRAFSSLACARWSSMPLEAINSRERAHHKVLSITYVNELVHQRFHQQAHRAHLHLLPHRQTHQRVHQRVHRQPLRRGHQLAPQRIHQRALRDSIRESFS